MASARRFLRAIAGRMTFRIRSIAPLVVVALIAAAVTLRPAAADELPPVHPRIVNGVLTDDYPTVGALLRGPDADTASTWCSGTLIGCSTFLTAGHCVEGKAPGDFRVFLPNAGIFAVTSIAQHPSYNFPAADVAVLKLASAVTGVAPTALQTTSVPFGTPGLIAGFGRSGDPLFDYGLKRAGNVVTASCTNIPSPGSNTTSICWDFLAPQGPTGTNSNTCNADSGGPLFVDLGSGRRVAGTTSGGSSASCNPTDHSYDANVATYHGYIEGEGGADLAHTACGSGPQVGEAGSSVEAFDGTLSSGTPQATHAITVPSGTTLLRIAMNAVDDGVADFDMYVRAGVPATVDDYDCGRFGPNQVGFCEFPMPAAGTVYVLVNRFSGSGTYQLTVTEFGTACALPGSDGLPCDDDNACTASDACQAGSCVGTPAADGTACSDGNPCTGPDTCQAGVCDSSPVANGTPCDDGDPCSRPDLCQAGSCTGTSPALTCKSAAPGNALLTVDNRSPDSRDRLGWTWRKGAATTLADFGNPTTTTSYALCLYDEVGGAPQRRLTKTIPPGSHWKQFTKGFRFRDATLASGGIQYITLTDGAAGRSSISLRGKGQPLTLPGLPFAKQPGVMIQLMNDSTCWSSTHTVAATNSLARFRAKGQ
jgi:hypothetical protein